MAKTKASTSSASTSRFRVLRTIQHGTVTLIKGDLVDFTDAQSGHLLVTAAIEPVATPVADGDVVDLSDADAKLVVAATA